MLLLIGAFLLVEVVGSVLTNSLALLADGHMLTDAVGVGLAPGHLVRRSPGDGGEVIRLLPAGDPAAAANAVLLFGMAGFILFEAVQRLREPSAVLTGPMLVIAGLGLLVNLVSLRLLHSGSQESLTVRGAYLGAGRPVRLGGGAGGGDGDHGDRLDPGRPDRIGGNRRPHPAAQLARLLSDAIDVLLQATPKGIDMAEVRQHLLGAENVTDIHDLHAWALTSGMNVVSAHVVMAPGADPAAVLDEICRCLSDDFDMEHSTIQLETSDRRRLEDTWHP